MCPITNSMAERRLRAYEGFALGGGLVLASAGPTRLSAGTEVRCGGLLTVSGIDLLDVFPAAKPPSARWRFGTRPVDVRHRSSIGRMRPRSEPAWVMSSPTHDLLAGRARHLHVITGPKAV